MLLRLPSRRTSPIAPKSFTMVASRESWLKSIRLTVHGVFSLNGILAHSPYQLLPVSQTSHSSLLKLKNLTLTAPSHERLSHSAQASHSSHQTMAKPWMRLLRHVQPQLTQLLLRHQSLVSMAKSLSYRQRWTAMKLRSHVWRTWPRKSDLRTFKPPKSSLAQLIIPPLKLASQAFRRKLLLKKRRQSPCGVDIGIGTKAKRHKSFRPSSKMSKLPELSL